MSTKVIRTIHPEIRVLDAAQGLVEYVASDESLDSYREIIRAKGWRFTHFQKNAPFVDSHSYDSINQLLGKVVDFTVSKGRLVETVKWAIDVATNQLAQHGFAMTQAGYLKAVSVGFMPVKMVSQWDADPSGYVKQLQQLGLEDADASAKPRAIYLEQEQVELSACVIGANPNALAKAYKAGVLDDGALEFFAQEHERREHARAATDPDDAARARHRAREAFLAKFNQAIRKL